MGGARDGGCGSGQGWRVWEGTEMEGVGGVRDGGCGRGQRWRVWEGTEMEGMGGDRDGGVLSSLYKAINFPPYQFVTNVCTLCVRAVFQNT